MKIEMNVNGNTPNQVEALGCPMIVDQCACHDIEGFVMECHELNGGYIGAILECNQRSKCKDCWVRFRAAQDIDSLVV